MIPGDFRRRAPHVDVDYIRAHSHRQPGGPGHLLRIIAEQLDARRPLLLIQLQELGAFSIPKIQTLGADHLAYHIGRAMLHANPPKSPIRNPCHGRQRRASRYLQAADMHTAASFLQVFSV